MLRVVSGGCPSSMPIVTNGPFPFQCIPYWDRHSQCVTVPAIPAPAAMKPGACYELGTVSWWTPLHITAVAVIAVCVAILLGFAVAAVRDRVRYRRFLQGAR